MGVISTNTLFQHFLTMISFAAHSLYWKLKNRANKSLATAGFCLFVICDQHSYNPSVFSERQMLKNENTKRRVSNILKVKVIAANKYLHHGPWTIVMTYSITTAVFIIEHNEMNLDLEPEYVKNIAFTVYDESIMFCLDFIVMTMNSCSFWVLIINELF